MVKSPVNISWMEAQGKVTHRLLTDCSHLVRTLSKDEALCSWLHAWWYRGTLALLEQDFSETEMLKRAKPTALVTLVHHCYYQGASGLSWTQCLEQMFLNFPALLEGACEPIAPRPLIIQSQLPDLPPVSPG